MPTHAKQHFIPRGYLSAWCDPKTPKGQEPYVWVHPLGGGPGRRKAPKGVFTETDIYTIGGAAGRDLSLEHALGKIETTFARIMRAIVEPKKPMGTADRTWLCAFVAALHARTPAKRDHLKSEFGRVVSWAERMTAHFEQMTPEQRRVAASVGSGGPGREISVDAFRTLAADPMAVMLTATLEAWTPILARMNLTILCASGPTHFITSDAPVAVVDRAATRRGALHDGPSVLSPTVEVSAPLSPTRAAVLSYLQAPLYHTVRDGYVREVNQTTIASAVESYVSNREEPEVGLRFKPQPSPGPQSASGA